MPILGARPTTGALRSSARSRDPGCTMKPANGLGNRVAFWSGVGSVLDIFPRPASPYEGWRGRGAAETVSEAILSDWQMVVSDYLRMSTREGFRMRIDEAISARARKLATG